MVDQLERFRCQQSYFTLEKIPFVGGRHLSVMSPFIMGKMDDVIWRLMVNGCLRLVTVWCYSAMCSMRELWVWIHKLFLKRKECPNWDQVWEVGGSSPPGSSCSFLFLLREFWGIGWSEWSKRWPTICTCLKWCGNYTFSHFWFGFFLF